MKKAIALVMMVALPVLIGCKSESSDKTDDTAAQTATKTETPTQQPTQQPAEPEIFSKPSGVRYQELVVGTGKEAVNQMPVECHYTLWFADSTGLQKVQRFQSSKDSNQPFQCQLGVRLIPGWSEGMLGMKEGGTRRIYIPWALGYGAQGGGPIPPKTNLIFEIDFLKAMQ
jgi:FKBP-type peptidyl-prolyl cis-trans isomerase FkpA